MTAGPKNINFYKLNNFNKIKTLKYDCSVIQTNFINGGYYLGDADDQFCWITEEG